jgi:hypothetical protein
VAPPRTQERQAASAGAEVGSGASDEEQPERHTRSAETANRQCEPAHGGTAEVTKADRRRARARQREATLRREREAEDAREQRPRTGKESRGRKQAGTHGDAGPDRPEERDGGSQQERQPDEVRRPRLTRETPKPEVPDHICSGGGGQNEPRRGERGPVRVGEERTGVDEHPRPAAPGEHLGQDPPSNDGIRVHGGKAGVVPDAGRNIAPTCERDRGSH